MSMKQQQRGSSVIYRDTFFDDSRGTPSVSLCTSNYITFALHLDSFFSAPLIFRLVLSKNRIWLRGRRWSLLGGGEERKVES